MKMMLALLILNAARPTGALAISGVPPNQEGDYVVLIHGLGRTRFSMASLERVLKAEGYRVINFTYPSTRISISEASLRLGGVLNARITDPSAKIHFVTHSLGAIVLREYLKNQSIGNLGRVVMLAPPNHGSEVADKLRSNVFYKMLTGPSGQELGTDLSGAAAQLGRADFDLGIIAGDRSFNPLFSSWIPGPNDGKVSVRGAQLEGMRDFLVVHHSHTWIMRRGQVKKAVISFIGSGHF